MEEIIKRARELAFSETSKYGTPPPLFLEIPSKKGRELARKLGANEDIVEIGAYLMDIKLGECKSEGKREEHIKRSVEATKNFLSQFNIEEENKNRILNCVEAHHASVPFECLEAEICANADCYKFLSPLGVFEYFRHLAIEGGELVEVFKQVEFKLEEKWKILSLDICKKELEPYYFEFKKLIVDAQKT